jgi:oxalate decarboxylase
MCICRDTNNLHSAVIHQFNIFRIILNNIPYYFAILFTNRPDTENNSGGKISRRDFLKYIGAAGAIFGLSSLPFSKTFAAGTNATNNSQTSPLPAPPSKSKQAPSSPHIFNLDGTSPQSSNAAGSGTTASADNFPILSDWAMAAFLVRLKKGGVLEPHWHPNAAELGYCIGGRAEMTIYPSNADADSFTVDTFTIDPGEMVFIPQGFMHDIENISNEEAKFVIAYNNERPTTIGVSGSVGSMPNLVMDKTFGIKPSNTFFNGFNKNSPKDIVTGSKPASVLEPGSSIPKIPNSHKFNVEGIPPQIQTPGGTVAKANTNSFPILSGSGLGFFSLIMKPSAVREPHWHPNASELGYVLEGMARLIVLSPGGSVDTFEVGPGQIYFIPTGFFHYIENLDTTKNMHFAIFFSSDIPGDIGISGTLSAYSNNVLGASFNLDPTYFNKLPRLTEDVLVVSGGG